MITAILLIIVFLLFGCVYYIKPQIFFFYWISLVPFIQPILYILFKPALTPIMEKFQPYLVHQSEPILFLMLLFAIKNIHKLQNLFFLILPLSLLISFFIFQNLFGGFDIVVLLKNILSVLWSVVPLALLMTSRRVRPSRQSLIRFVVFFVIIQIIFCIFNIFGYKVYEETVENDFEESLIRGTFTRFNVMAEYLSIFFFLLSYEYMENKGLRRKTYYLIAFLMGLMIILSGSRMSLILFIFAIFFCVFVYKSKKYVFVSLVAFVSSFSIYIIGNEHFAGQRAVGGTGLERNLIGIIDLANSDDISEGNTMSASAYLLFYKLNSPIFGNGKAYRKDYFYGNPNIDQYNEGLFKVDATLAFMFVEYGIIGLSLFFFLFASIFKACYLFSQERKKYLYWGAGLYFLLYSVTDPGFWHYTFFSFFVIYVFSEDKKKNAICVLKTEGNKSDMLVNRI